ncbi:hypothetical protein F4561_002653 [Lipingzhangella halophila]|uniref:N-acetylmuramoyl-L-alanine amidase n=1 Tax=Lipingzhangella halophila TaxID=1783352 RepID=A0A7W7RH09_9ACTN|nr:peptidoglycan recognition family protein [Lipingzhangella halophila]MBB4931833.1 hypothetical protein [Lipingzhangella halophila]
MPRPDRLVWRSDLGWPSSSPAAYANPRSGLVIHYDSSNQNLANRPHSACVDYWNWCRDFHVNGNGWADVGYSWMACAHGYVMEGRGLYRAQAAQPGGNTTYYSCTLACGPSDEITGAQIEAVRQLRSWLMEPDTSISGTVKGHRDFNSTSCPGDAAYRLVSNGTFRQQPSGLTPTEEDNDVPTYVSIEKTDNSRKEELQSGEWHQVYFDANNSGGADNHHGDGDYPSLVKGAADYTGYVSLRLTDVPKGVECQARMVEVHNDGESWVVVERDAPVEFEGTNGDTFVTIPAAGFVNDDRRLRVEVVHYADQDVTPRVIAGKVRLQVWER